MDSERTPTTRSAPGAQASALPPEGHPDRITFIVGNSRSGTTMMMRIINNHPLLHALSELHFFEQLWSPADRERTLEPQAALRLADRLFHVAHEGYLTRYAEGKYKQQAEALMRSMEGVPLYGHEVFRAVIFEVTRSAGKQIPCEKTPQNVFYIKEILELYPHARILNMVRDPRGVLLSQKRKWKRRRMGAHFITWREATRLRINYHPITISRLWNSSVGAALKHLDHPQVMTVHFEDIIEDSERTIRRICDFFGVSFDPAMLDVPHLGSSNEADDPSKKGIKKERAGNWRKGGLNDAEIWFCQRMTGKYMKPMDYPVVEVRPNPLAVAGYYLSFPFKIALAVLVNLGRMKSIADTIKRRMVG
jgi:omega-hydroxy-beta-dihydromenaquinone-9 sulfotransferase